MKEIVIGIVGSRRRDEEKDFQAVYKKLIRIRQDLFLKYGADIKIKYVSGGCYRGADSFVERLSNLTGDDFYEHLPKLPANYDKLSGHAKRWAYAKAAYARNKFIAQDSNILIACVATDRTGGTENTIEWFRKLHKGTRKLVLV